MQLENDLDIFEAVGTDTKSIVLINVNNNVNVLIDVILRVINVSISVINFCRLPHLLPDFVSLRKTDSGLPSEIVKHCRANKEPSVVCCPLSATSMQTESVRAVNSE